MLLVGALLVGALLAFRHRAYRRHIAYDPGQNCVATFASDSVEVTSIDCDPTGFTLPDLGPKAIGGLLELDVRASLLGRLFDPGVEIEAAGFRDPQIMERGVGGTRFLNVSRLLAAGLKPGTRVALRGRQLSLA